MRAFRHKVGEVIVPKTSMLLRCALSHTWEGTYEVIHGGYRKGPGHRPRPVINSIYTPANCPVCGHRCMGGVPVQAAPVSPQSI